MKWKERGMVSMINKDYFKYLIKQNKKYLILIYVIGIIIPFLLINKFDYVPLNDENITRFAQIILLAYGFMLSFIVPIYLFSFLQKKKSNILYFSLPIKKESLYLTTSLFSYFATILPVVIYQIISQLISNYMISFPLDKFILAIIITIVHMFAMNTIITFVTLSSQNMTDSLICSIAYMIIPFVVFLALNICATKVAQTFMMGYGNYSQSLKLLLNYISIVYSGFFQGNYLLSPFVSNTPIIYWFILSIIFSLINYHLFLKRTLEKSETYTKSIFMYPLIIILSTLSMMLFVYDLEDLKMTTLMFSVIFIIYLIMYYFSKRKVYFSWKIPSLFILLIIGCIGFSNIYSNTKGLNTIYELPKNKDIQEIYFSTDRYIFDEDKPSTVDNQEIENLTTKNITIQNKKNFMKSMYEIMNKNLITKSADYHGYENYYELTISFTTKNTINPNRNYIIKDENMAAVLDIFSKYDIIKNK